MRATVARRTIAGAAVAIALTLSAGACGGGGVDKDKLVSKLKTDDAFKSLPDKEVKCIADVAIKYGNKKKINDYIDGKKGSSDGMDAAMSSANEKKAETAAKKCVQ